MRTKKLKQLEDGSSYDLSISDLMAALCCIFILVTIAIVSSLKDKNTLAEKYQTLQQELFVDIEKELGDSLKKWDAKVDPDTLAIRFSADSSFEAYSAKMNPRFEEIMDEFFPKLVAILEKDKYKGEIEELRIEGFTAPDKNDKDGEGSEHDFKEGIELSQARTRAVLLYCLEETDYSQEKNPAKKDQEKDWLRKHIVANGYSLAKPLDSQGNPTTDPKKIDKKMTRRVEFRIKTNSDNIVKQFQELNNSTPKK